MDFDQELTRLLHNVASTIHGAMSYRGMDENQLCSESGMARRRLHEILGARCLTLRMKEVVRLAHALDCRVKTTLFDLEPAFQAKEGDHEPDTET